MPEDNSFLEDDRGDAQNRAFTQHGNLSFMGIPLRPLSVGTMSLMDQTGNRLLKRSDVPFFDAAAFVLLHQSDEQAAREARAMAWNGRIAWNEFVFEFIESKPDIAEHLVKAAPMFRQMIEDYQAILTKSLSVAGSKKNAGRRDSSPTSSKR